MADSTDLIRAIGAVRNAIKTNAGLDWRAAELVANAAEELITLRAEHAKLNDLAQLQGLTMAPLVSTLQDKAARLAELEAVQALQRYARVSDKPLWRVGRKLGRTVYCGDSFVGMFDTAEYAAAAVAALNSIHEHGDGDV